MPLDAGMPLYTPDDIMRGTKPGGKVVIYDDDHYYMGGVLAELLVQEGCDVTIITPSAYLSDWTVNTLEQHAIHKKLAGMGVEIILNHGVAEIAQDHVKANCVYTDAIRNCACEAVVMVASKLENNGVYLDLKSREDEWADAGIKSVKLIGDANAPGPIAWATYAGHRYARELDGDDIGDALPFRREITELARD
ncbi:dimethylamine/trimethylamine dehydrogenase [Roseobacter denitrificans OCh 114]|uniref:Trimethylamine dehydrogenase n=1 Tax=Roseobacter denitrificans (strain ATCC 33942 / OCh 114) TaxID=375451 RepID=Q160L1_ROSDO|nr:trimethylamine dehydrogenase [Roseobacter denitrificans OCh 114]SFG04099.1 dimethylamine/trimethylamine dehydrogenase [Roseobacter denitrificans OCh 114]